MIKKPILSGPAADLVELENIAFSSSFSVKSGQFSSEFEWDIVEFSIWLLSELSEAAGNRAVKKASHFSEKSVALFWLYWIMGVFSSFLCLQYL